uniref:Uncharacterized protein n=1 Tax=uncultured marine group II/III euryarchaeote KM3_181_H05 TaxID=1457945 RepID=A0A075GSU6_9EURY|nr:hypothetical protein [uncultured marine group II/III euryarchaeote KM3_181_H05]
MRTRVAWLALLLLLPATPVAAEGLMPEVWLEVDFETDRKLVVELRVATGGGLAGDRLPGGADELARPAFDEPALNRMARALANDSNGFSAQLLAGQLLFGHLAWETLEGSELYSNEVSLNTVELYPNGFRVVLAVMLDPALPLELRPLYCLYDNPRLVGGEEAAFSGYEVTLTARGSTTFSANSVQFNHLRWLQPGATLAMPGFGITFSSRELYLDPTELLGVGERYDAQTAVIVVVPAGQHSNPYLMLGTYTLLIGFSWLLLRRNREYRLRFGIYRWLAVAALFPLAFIPLSGPLFMVAALLSALWDTARVAQTSQDRKGKRAQAPVLEVIEAPEEVIDGGDRQLTGEVLPDERELLDELLEETTPDALGELAPGEGKLLEGEFEETQVLANRQSEASELQPLPTASCPGCDAAVEENWKACPSCGASLGDGETASGSPMAEALAAGSASTGGGADAGTDASSTGGEPLEAQAVSMDELLESLESEGGLPEGDEEEPEADGGAGAEGDGDVMDELKKKLEELGD